MQSTTAADPNQLNLIVQDTSGSWSIYTYSREYKNTIQELKLTLTTWSGEKWNGAVSYNVVRHK